MHVGNLELVRINQDILHWRVLFVEPLRMRKTFNSSCRSISFFALVHRAFAFHPVAGGWIQVLGLADPIGRGDAQVIAGIDIQDSQPPFRVWGQDF